MVREDNPLDELRGVSGGVPASNTDEAPEEVEGVSYSEGEPEGETEYGEMGENAVPSELEELDGRVRSLGEREVIEESDLPGEGISLLEIVRYEPWAEGSDSTGDGGSGAGCRVSFPLKRDERKPNPNFMLFWDRITAPMLTPMLAADWPHEAF